MSEPPMGRGSAAACGCSLIDTVALRRLMRGMDLIPALRAVGGGALSGLHCFLGLNCSKHMAGGW